MKNLASLMNGLVLSNGPRPNDLSDIAFRPVANVRTCHRCVLERYYYFMSVWGHLNKLNGYITSLFSCKRGRVKLEALLLEALLLPWQNMGEPRNKRTADVGDFTWNSMSGRSVGLEPVPLQSLSELERVRLQDVAFSRLLRDYDLGCQITIPKDGQKRKKSLRKKLDSLSKEKSKDKETAPQAFGIPLSQVISNDRAYKQRLEPEREGRWDAGGDPAAFSSLRLASSSKRSNKELSSSNSSLSSTCETPHDSPLPCQPQAVQRIRRRGGVSVDCITDLDDNQSRLLEALQLSLPVEPPSNRKKHSDKKLSLNPIYRQVPRVIDCCCQHLEKHGLQTVGIFRVGSSKKRARQLREEFDLGMEVQLDEDHSVHDVAALLKEFLRDMPEPLLTRELYTAFINSILLDNSDQVTAIQLLIYLLPPCNSDTLQRLLHFLSTVAAHAEDRLNSRGSETTGNKMTSLNLATIFGPNLLHMLKTTDKEFVVQSFARAEESTAIISVVQTMITNYKTLFMVPSDLQNEVLMSVLETDADVVDYLLRRKASQYSSPSLLRTGESFSLSDRRSSSDSNKPSSGEASPYDNNSPVPSESPLSQCHGDSGLFGLSGIHKAAGNCSSGAGDSCTTPSSGDDAPDEHFWGDWHSLFRKELLDSDLTGYHGDVSKRESYGLSEELHRHQGNSQLPVGQKQTSLGEAECRPHLPLTRCSSSPHDQRRQRQPELHQNLHNQSRAISSDDLAGRTNQQTISPCVKGSKTDGWSLFCFPEPLKDTYISNSTPSLSSNPSGGLSVVAPGEASRRTSRFPAPPCPVLPSGEGTELAAPECQRERWHIWQLLSTDSVDTLPETLV